MNQPLDLAPIAVTANRRIPLDPDYPRSSPETKQEKRKREKKKKGGGKRERERASRWNEEGNPAGSWRRSLITGQDEMCFWQEKSRIANKWSGRGGPRVPASRGRDRGAVTLMAEVGRIKHGKSTEKRQFMMVGKKITV